jgi:hypothetical protein
MSDSKAIRNKEVYVCVIHDSEVYTGLHQNATFSSCKKFLDEVVSGKRKTFKIFFAKGKVLKITSFNNNKDKDYELLITKVYLRVSSDITTEGRNAFYSDLWIKVGKYARKQILNDNPSRRKLIKGLE